MDVLIYGGGMLGQQVAYLMVTHFADSHNLLGFIDDTQDAGTDVSEGLKTVGSLERAAASNEYGPGRVHLVFGIGYSNMPARREAFERAKSSGYDFLTLIHPNASVEPSAQLGEGVVVLAGAVVDQYVSVGDLSYLHIGTKIGEKCRLGANNYFSAGATFGGSVQVGSGNFFGINATIVNDITIGSNCFINAGSLIYKPVDDNLRMVEFREQRGVANR